MPTSSRPSLDRSAVMGLVLCCAVLLLTGCGTLGDGDTQAGGQSGSSPSAGSVSGNASGAEPDPLSTIGTRGRTGFKPQPLPARAGKRGGSPAEIARDLYGTTEPVEGAYTERMQSRSTDPSTQVVLFTQTGLPDDSVRGERRRLEFRLKGSSWHLEWVGLQVQCWPGRGHEDWSNQPCL
jgi:hypothetical protein